jgi:hypothetical protein
VIHEVDNPCKNGGGPLEFADVVCLLHRRYIKLSTAQRATCTFENVQWKVDEGPEGLYTDLTQAGDRMIEAPLQFML